MSPITIAALKEQATEKPLLAAIHAQLQSRANRTTKNGKPYLELALADATGHFSLKIWSDSPHYLQADALEPGVVLRVQGKWTQGSFGIEARDPEFQTAEESVLAGFFAGDPALSAKQELDFQSISNFCASIADPRLHALCQHFLESHGLHFRRTAAARRNHHARRGGLVEHVAQMMRSADALCHVYHDLNRDLILAGILFHDCGKLWENSYPENGFTQSISAYGEMMGHITLGIELTNRLWHETMASADAAAWNDLTPSSSDVRLHLLHLIASHHGEHQFGSPVLPRTPEAFALHYIDNLDAKLEMVRDAYLQSPQIAPGIHDRVFPLPTNLVRPLPRHTPADHPQQPQPETQLP